MSDILHETGLMLNEEQQRKDNVQSSRVAKKNADELLGFVTELRHTFYSHI